MSLEVEFVLREYLEKHKLTVQKLFDTLTALNSGTSPISRNTLYAYTRANREVEVGLFPTIGKLPLIARGLEHMTGIKVAPNDLLVFKGSTPFLEEGREKEKQEGYQAAAEFYKEKLNSDKIKDNFILEGKLRESLGRALHRLGRIGDLDSAIEEYKKSRKCFEKLHDFIGVAQSFINEADSLRILGKHEEAEKIYWEALDELRNPSTDSEVWEQLRYGYLEARALRGVGGTLRRRGFAYDSIMFYELGLRVLENLKSKDGREYELEEDILQLRGYILNSMGVAFRHHDDLDKSIDVHKEALEISRGLRDSFKDYKRLEASSHHGLCDSLRKKSRVSKRWESRYLLDEAEHHYEKAKKLFEEVYDSRGKAYTSYSLSFIYYYRGRNASDKGERKRHLKLAREKVNEALEFQKGVELRGEAYSQYLSGKIYLEEYKLESENNKYEEARKSYHQALEIFEKVGNSRGMRHILNALGLLFYNKVRSISSEMKEKEEAHQKEGAKDILSTSKKYFKKAESILHGNLVNGDRVDGYNYVYLARVYADEFDLGNRNFKQSEQYLNKAILIFNKINHIRGKAMVYEALGDVKGNQRIKGSARQAVIHYRVAEKHYENIDVEGAVRRIKGKLEKLGV